MPMPPDKGGVPRTGRDEDVAWREQIRREDLEFRQTSRQLDHQLRRRESQLNTRRAALAAAVEASPESTDPAVLLDLAARFEDWVKRPSHEHAEREAAYSSGSVVNKSG